MTEVNEALNIIRNIPFPKRNTEARPAREALNCILAEDVKAKQDIPRFDNSAMDGFTMRKADLDSGQRTFPIAFEVRPENPDPGELPEKECAAIMTGGKIPPGADFVIPVEMAEVENDKVTFTDTPSRNPVRKQGEGYKTSQTLLKAGSLIRPYESGLCIESGNPEILVNKPLRIGLQVTGNEIDESNNTNGPVLHGLISRWPGTRVTEYPVLGDNPKNVTARLKELKLACDLVITTGGISAGKHDYLFAGLQRLGAKCLIRKINQKPGKPFTLFRWEDTIVCCLPGNPVSSVFTAEYYARRIVHLMNGLKEPGEFKAAASAALENGSPKTLFVPGVLSFKDGQLFVDADSNMRSHLMQLYSGCNVYVKLDPQSEYKKGENVTCLPFTTGL